MILWFSGISGVGKTTIANFYKKNFKKKLIHLDGDQFRKLFSNDLKYSLKDRDKNARRLISFVDYLAHQKFNIIVSANLTSEKYRKLCKMKFTNYVHVFIDAKFSSLMKRDYKKLYRKSFKNKIKNIVGVDIKFKKPKDYDLIINNDSSKTIFLKNIKNIDNYIKSKKIKIY